MNRANHLIGLLMSNPDCSEFETLVNELLMEYHRGSAVGSLRNLLQSPNDRVVGEGAWIASELGETGKPLLPDIGRLLSHSSKKVRFWSIDCVHLWASPSDSHELAAAATLADDAEAAVRWKAMGFLALASREQLQGAFNGLEAAQTESSYVDELKWMLSPEGADPAEITVRLRDRDARHRKVAVVAAVRIAVNNSEPLRSAAFSDDAEIAQFATDMLKRINAS